jgi:hypothetical protein
MCELRHTSRRKMQAIDPVGAGFVRKEMRLQVFFAGKAGQWCFGPSITRRLGADHSPAAADVATVVSG